MNPNPCAKCGGEPVQQCVDGVFVVACEKCETQCDSLESFDAAIGNWNEHNPLPDKPADNT
jgi:hypothetical protein